MRWEVGKAGKWGALGLEKGDGGGYASCCSGPTSYLCCCCCLCTLMAGSFLSRGLHGLLGKRREAEGKRRGAADAVLMRWPGLGELQGGPA